MKGIEKEKISTFLGESLPDGWTTATIEDIIASEGIFIDGDWVESKDQDPLGEVRLIQLADVGDGVYRNRSERYLTSAKAKELGCTFLESGDVLIARMPDPLGRACIFPGDSKSSVTVVDVCIIRTGANGPEHCWLMYTVNSPAFRSAVASLQSGSTRQRISRSNLASLEIPIPPLREQHRIVAAIEQQFSRLDAAVTSLQHARAKLKRQRATILKAAVEGTLTADWRAQHPASETAEQLLQRILNERRAKWEAEQLAKMQAKGVTPKDDSWKKAYKEPEPLDMANLPELPEGWAWASVEMIGDINEQAVLTGPFGSNLGREDFIDSGVPVLTIGCLTEQGLSLEKAFHISDIKASELERYRVKVGDILFSRMASVGRADFVSSQFAGSIINYHLMRLRLERTVINYNYFIAYVRGSKAVVDYIKEVNHGVTRDGINTNQLLALPVAIPPYSEQQQIVSEVEARLSIIAQTELEVEANLKRAERLRQTILAEAFAGRLVPQDPDDEPANVLLERIRGEREGMQKKGKAGNGRAIRMPDEPVKIDAEGMEQVELWESKS